MIAALPIYIAVIIGFGASAYGAYLVWYRRKVEDLFHDKLYASFNKYYTDNELEEIATKLRNNQKIDAITFNKLNEFYIQTLKELSPKESEVIANALYQPSTKGRENYIIKTALELIPHSH